MEDDLLALETRRRLFEIIRRAPGIGGREAQRRAGTAWGETAYHLERLCDAGVVHREQGLHRDRYFVASVPIGDRALLGLVRSTSARRLLLALLETPGATVPELADRTGLSTGRISVHLARFVETRHLRTGRRGRLRSFEVVDRPRVLRVLVSYRSSFGDEWIERALATWSELFRP